MILVRKKGEWEKYLCLVTHHRSQMSRWSSRRMSTCWINTYYHLLTYFLTPWSRVLLEKLAGSAASQEIPLIFGTQRFLTVLTSARHLSLTSASSIQSTQPPPTSWTSFLILFFHLRLGLPSGLFPSGFPTRTLCTSLPSPYPPALSHTYAKYLYMQSV